MLATIQKELRDLLARNRIDQFFERWTDAVDPNSEHATIVTLRQSDWVGLKREERLGIIESDKAATRRSRIVYALLGIVSDLSPADLLGFSGTPPPTPTSGAPAGPSPALRELLRRKLESLQKERILATDASVKFKLDEEIREIKEQLG